MTAAKPHQEFSLPNTNAVSGRSTTNGHPSRTGGSRAFGIYGVSNDHTAGRAVQTPIHRVAFRGDVVYLVVMLSRWRGRGGWTSGRIYVDDDGESESSSLRNDSGMKLMACYDTYLVSSWWTSLSVPSILFYPQSFTLLSLDLGWLSCCSPI